MIANHEAPSLSELDLLGISYVPPGGNWKDIPESVPSRRLENIRQGYAAGKGSRSTYYGRLTPDMPAYTISTNFNRPGCGCNTHYSQDRTLTYREAARIQSFPDCFEFFGSKSSIAKQIGNAVPPLLGYQIASALPFTGAFVDLFAGAGGLALGFLWAGWEPIISNDVEASFLETHEKNIGGKTVCGDVSDPNVRESIAEAVLGYREKHPGTPAFVLGGPPCQGFSTANYRTMQDARNWLFKEYIKVLKAVNPEGFIFENVTGILNFDKGRFFPKILDELSECVEAHKVEKVNSANFGIPQRRERVLVIGSDAATVDAFEMQPITRVDVRTKSVSKATNRGVDETFPLVPTAEDALGDLPTLKEGEDASAGEYTRSPENDYQSLMRGAISPQCYIRSLKDRHS
ncbi:DNA (cytosine-5-)-methyltransferase [Olegusella massiliensis]|uniref:DNA (cytosine-5-)-methyltransferase n=1 Tax=Olegusella massiliensis TaxID=1776381 RepID=UPI0040556501